MKKEYLISNKIKHFYYEYIKNNDTILKYTDDNGIIKLENKIIIKFNIKVDEIDYVTIEYCVDSEVNSYLYKISFIPIIGYINENQNQNQNILYFNDEKKLIKYLLNIIYQLINAERKILYLLFSTETFLTEDRPLNNLI